MTKLPATPGKNRSPADELLRAKGVKTPAAAKRTKQAGECLTDAEREVPDRK
ncbi:hypothetical protein GCM10009628_40620 [Paeniglutamicibacter kerguelensis]